VNAVSSAAVRERGGGEERRGGVDGVIGGGGAFSKPPVNTSLAPPPPPPQPQDSSLEPPTHLQLPPPPSLVLSRASGTLRARVRRTRTGVASRASKHFIPPLFPYFCVYGVRARGSPRPEAPRCVLGICFFRLRVSKPPVRLCCVNLSHPPRRPPSPRPPSSPPRGLVGPVLIGCPGLPDPPWIKARRCQLRG
jgi:hypothetical protein